jgi:histone deacetylase 1/2
VYDLQGGETHSEDTDDPDKYRWDSDDSVVSSSRRRRHTHAPKSYKKRMSILTNQYFDIPSYENGFEYAIPGQPDSRRRYFQTVARWDVRAQMVVLPGRNMPPIPNFRRRRMASPPRMSRYSDDERGEEEESSMEEDDNAPDEATTESGDDEDMSTDMLEY